MAMSSWTRMMMPTILTLARFTPSLLMNQPDWLNSGRGPDLIFSEFVFHLLDCQTRCFVLFCADIYNRCAPTFSTVLSASADIVMRAQPWPRSPHGPRLKHPIVTTVALVIVEPQHSAES